MEGAIATMSMLTWVFIVGAIVLATVKRAKRSSGNTATKDKLYASTDQLYGSRKSFAGRGQKSSVNTGGKNTGDGMILRDDRNNDWLACQLREEAKARVRMSDMFQMKIEHMNKCDAEFIRRFHESNCDAEGIDTGTRKRTKSV